MQDVNRRNINSFHRQVQLIFEQRARILFGFVLFFFFAFIVKHCNGNRWVHVVLQYKSKNKSSKVVDLYQDSQSQEPRTPAWVSGVSGGKGRERCEKGRQRRERNFLSLSPPLLSTISSSLPPEKGLIHRRQTRTCHQASFVTKIKGQRAIKD